MKYYTDPKSILALEFRDGALFDTLVIHYKNGQKKTIRQFLDVNWELESLYHKLLNEIELYNNEL